MDERFYGQDALFYFPLIDAGAQDFAVGFSPASASGDAKLFTDQQIFTNIAAEMVAFDSGSEEPVNGDELAGASSAETCDFMFAIVTSGTWAGTDAAGVLFVKNVSGAFQTENLNITGGTSNVMGIAEDFTASLFGEIGNGAFCLALTAAEMQCKQGEIHIIDSATKQWKDQAIQFETRGHPLALHPYDSVPSYDIPGAGTPQAVDATTVTLPATASSVDGAYVAVIMVESGKPTKMMWGSYAGSGTVFTFDPAPGVTYTTAAVVYPVAVPANATLDVPDTNPITIEGTDATDALEAAANAALVALKLDHLVAVADADDPVNDSIMAKIAADGGDWSTFDDATDSLEAIRDRGDAAWITGGGGGLTDILNIQPLVAPSIDLANTATWRLGLMLTNALDDLPSTAEITPGTISIDRKAMGGTSWSSVVSDAACSEDAGLIYFDEVFDAGSGYADGDSIRITFKSQKITVSANDYEITDATGRIFYSSIREEIGAAGIALTAITAKTNLFPDTVDGYTLTQLLAVFLSALGGEISDADTTTPQLWNPAGTQVRIDVTTDANGNRTGISFSFTGV